MSTVTEPALANSSALSNYIAQQNAAAAAATASSTTTSTANGAGAFSSLAGSETTFLKILTTQLQNQDPTAATDTNQFTQELVQFTQAEQQLNTNSKLDSLIALQKNSSGLASTLNYIGKYVEVPTTSQLPLQGSQAELAYTLPSAAKTVSIAVLDSTGKTVTTLSGPAASGLDRVAWDGKDSSGTQLADGTYTFQLSATDASGSALTVTDMRAVGLVTSLASATDGTTNLTLSTGMSVSSSTVDAVYDSSNLPTGTLGDPATTTTNTNTSS
jgi:flagellar basal-body rod modification protein FlgD